MIYFSVFQGSQSDDLNLKNTLEISKYLKAKGIEYRLVQGIYKGSSEISFQVPDSALEDALLIASLYSQESILVVDPEAGSHLFYLDGDHLVQEFIGVFQRINWTEIFDQDSLSIIGNKVFAVKG